MFTNFVLLLGMAIGLAGLTALGIMALVKWIASSPMLLIGILIGAIVAVFATIKIRNAQDADLVERYHQSQEHEPITQTPKRTLGQTKTKQPDIDIDGLAEALVRYGYSKSESIRAIETVLADNPELSETDIITQAWHIMSGDLVRN